MTRPSLLVFLYILYLSASNSPVYSVGVMFSATVMIIINIIYRVYSVICPHIRILKKIQYYIHNFCRRPTRNTFTPIMRVDFHSPKSKHISYSVSCEQRRIYIYFNNHINHYNTIIIYKPIGYILYLIMLYVSLYFQSLVIIIFVRSTAIRLLKYLYYNS